jgi:hypothetical protein
VTPFYEEGSSKTRYLELSNVLQKIREEEKIGSNQISILQEYEAALQESKNFYLNKYGTDIIFLSNLMENNEKFRKVIQYPLDSFKKMLFF